MDNLAKEKGLFATGWRVLSGGHVISGSRRSTLNAFSIMSINPARACLAGMILMITGVLVRNWNASHRVPLRAMKMVLQATVLRLMFAGIKMSGVSTVSLGLSLIFSDSNQRQEVSLEGQERIWSSPYLIVDFLPNLYYEQNTEHDTPYYKPYKTFDIVPAFEASHLLWRSYENSWEQIFSAGVGASQKTLWHGCRHPTRLRATY